MSVFYMNVVIAIFLKQFPLMVEMKDTEELSYFNLIANDTTCSSFINCDHCLRQKGCSWCSKYLDSPKEEKSWKTSELKKPPRCGKSEWLRSASSNCISLEDPSNTIKLVDNRPITSESFESQQEEYVQISPQHVQLQLRVGIPTTIKFKVAQAKQYPVDLYYLMDLSNSMSDDRDTVVRLGEELAEAIQKITGDFRIGFGSFVDKEVMPFISLVTGKNCQQSTCSQPYSFQHQMSLSPSAKMFSEKVKNAIISGNIDNPEGGFDGLLQAMVCNEEIGWRKNARRVIIFTTDQSFHMANDGKLGGIVKPNDGLCHLNTTGHYTKSKEQDYPSVGQINYLARKHNVHIIWAVTEDKVDLYESLTHLVDGSTAGAISKDSSNIVELVQKQYEEITTTIRVKDNSGPDCLTKIESDCLPGLGPKCNNVDLGKAVEFRLTVELKRCQAETFEVQAVGLKDRLLIEASPLCECPCNEHEGTIMTCSSGECSKHGDVVCGDCKCCPDFYGNQCECVISEAPGQVNPLQPEASCKPINASGNALICSGQGECVCGQCQCLKPWSGVEISGPFCEKICDNTACDRSPSGKLCGGHGECLCGDCICEPPWIGPGCQCRNQPSLCVAPNGTGQVCSGRGECPCDACICTEEGYSGRFCEICETCDNICQELRVCAECLAFETGSDQQQQIEKNDNLSNCSMSCPYDYYETPTASVPKTWNNCTFYIEDCKYSFSYSYFLDSKKVHSLILHLYSGNGEPPYEKKKCPPDPNFLGIILTVIGAIIFIGMLTIFLWKIFTTIHDRREFAKFEEERKEIKFPSHANPIFRQATTTVHNPTFNMKHHF